MNNKGDCPFNFFFGVYLNGKPVEREEKMHTKYVAILGGNLFEKSRMGYRTLLDLKQQPHNPRPVLYPTALAPTAVPFRVNQWAISPHWQ